MSEKPILFSTPMVRAIQKLIKTMTRRLNGLKEINENPDQWSICQFAYDRRTGLRVEVTFKDHERNLKHIKIPYQIGDILWVRETWTDPTPDKCGYPILYKADLPMHWDACDTEHGDEVTLRVEDYKWRPSIFMPRAACRLFLKVKNVRVERLQDITEEDARAEGVSPNMTSIAATRPEEIPAIHQIEFIKLWNSLNAKRGYGWDSNPWVFVVDFEVIKP